MIRRDFLKRLVALFAAVAIPSRMAWALRAPAMVRVRVAHSETCCGSVNCGSFYLSLESDDPLLWWKDHPEDGVIPARVITAKERKAGVIWLATNGCDRERACSAQTDALKRGATLYTPIEEIYGRWNFGYGLGYGLMSSSGPALKALQEVA